MKYPNPITLLSLSAILTVASASGSYAQAPQEKTIENTASTETDGTNQTGDGIVVKTILPSRAKATVPYQWLVQQLKATDAETASVAQSVMTPKVVVPPGDQSTEMAQATETATPSLPEATAPNTSPAGSQRELETESAKSEIAPSKPDTPFPPGQPEETVPQAETTETTPASPVPGSTDTSAEKLTRKVPVPAYLNPHPNPLTFPTKPDEVKITGAQPITLDQAIELGERNNRTIEQAKIQVERAQDAVREAQGANFPSIFIQSDLTRSQSADAELNVRQQLDDLERDLNSDDFATRFQAQQNEAALRDNLRDVDDPDNRFNTSINLSYDVFTSGRRRNQIIAAERLLRIAELELDRVRAQTRFDVSDTYYQLQDAEEQIKINQAAVKSSQSNLRDTQAQFEAGLGTKFDVLRVQVQLANNQQQLETALANREIQRRRLAQRISLPEKVIVIPAEQVPEAAGKWPLNLEQTIVLAYKNRAELEQQLVQREVSEARRKVALSALGPTVSLIGQLNFLEVFDDSVGFGTGYSIGARAQWQIFDGGVSQAQAAQQIKDKELAESRFAEQREAIRFEVEQSYATMLANNKSIETTTLAVTQAEEALRLATLRFNAGVGTQTERIDAESDLTRARGNRTSAIIGYNRALAQLRRAVSNLPLDVLRTGRVTQE